VKTSTIILAVMGLFLLAFIAAMTVIFCVKGAVPDTLIQYTLGAGGVEALLLAGIKISKVVTGDKPGVRPPEGGPSPKPAEGWPTGEREEPYE
jgi:hypothetical protein